MMQATERGMLSVGFSSGALVFRSAIRARLASNDVPLPIGFQGMGDSWRKKETFDRNPRHNKESASRHDKHYEKFSAMVVGVQIKRQKRRAPDLSSCEPEGLKQA
jgi:hypothetical protein